MTIPLTGTGGLFTRVGTMGGLLNDVNSFRGTANLTAASIKSIGPAVDSIAAQFDSTDQNLINGLYGNRDSYRTVHSSLTQYIQQLAQSTLVQMANDDTPLAVQDLTHALTLLISQMKTGSQTVQKPTVSESVTAGGSNVGGGVVIASVLGGNGTQLDYVLNENVSLTCTLDAQTTGTAGQEQFTVASPTSDSDPLDWQWPLGSGVSLTQNAVDANQSNSGGNLLQNSGFETWTNANQPDNWIRDVGVIGTTILQGATAYKGTYSLELVGNGSELTSVYQPFNTAPSTSSNAGGTSAVLSPSTQYAVNLWSRYSGTTPAAGVIEVALTDGAGTVTQDGAGNQNLFTVAFGTLTTSFVPHNGWFRTPAVLPSTGFRLRVRFSTAFTSGTNVFIDNLALTPGFTLYTGGPQLAIFSGSPNFIIGDTFTAAVTNSYNSGWQKLADRLFGMKALGLQLPSGGSPTIADSLIA